MAELLVVQICIRGKNYLHKLTVYILPLWPYENDQSILKDSE